MAIKITPNQKRVLTHSIVTTLFFFAFLYFSAQYPIVTFTAQLFLAILVISMLNFVAGGRFQDNRAIYGELLLTVIIVLVFNQFGLNFTTGFLLTGAVLFAMFMIYLLFLKPLVVTKGDGSQKQIGRGFIGGADRKSWGGGLIRTGFSALFFVVAFIIIFTFIITMNYITLLAILFLAMILDALIEGSYLDTKHVLAFLLVSAIIVLALQQMNLLSILTFNTADWGIMLTNAVILFVILFAANYLFLRIGVVKGENVPTKQVGK
ncbi:MAG: hypothetical protein KGJ89_05605 [Patescibacteria group bacterium]|nr:hypothetical protein [Patescibacteria group bacterium]